VLFLAFLGLVFAPVTVSVPPHLPELIVLIGGLIVMLAINLLVLRPVFRPLDELADTMRRHDPLSPGRRARIDGDPAVAALARTFNEMLERMEAERRESAHQALMVQEAERARIARELHDEVGQTLTGVMLQVEGLAAVIPDQLREQLDELRETARDGTEEVRRIARRLRPEALEDLGLQSALSALASRVADQAHLDVSRQLDSRLTLSQQQELVVYRVAQEALTNVVRHAGAAHVELRLDRDDGNAVLCVRDDGRGVQSDDLMSSSGIRGMRERAMLIGARLAIEPGAEQGTEVRLIIPLDPTPI
jgi:two-component system sensor histidine kinase UhpB